MELIVSIVELKLETFFVGINVYEKLIVSIVELKPFYGIVRLNKTAQN